MQCGVLMRASKPETADQNSTFIFLLAPHHALLHHVCTYHNILCLVGTLYCSMYARYVSMWLKLQVCKVL